ncbi:hypothetical protein [Pseudonocardia sp. ICBG601]|uniref:hypothetical protein n=1 Tax=Pseudonocardia sp. ICBG601 TaxID=2846759 RepID=UPI001CF64F97|nr:hypothetical protein [Pseudonocardia sp. ICBG601]
MKIRSTIAVVIVAGVMAAISAGPAWASAMPAPNSATVVEREDHGDLARLTGYSDVDILKLLLAGQGDAADQHPQLRTILGFAPDKPNTLDEPLMGVIRDYLRTSPSFHSSVSEPLQSGDPERVDEALRSFTKSFIEFAHSNQKIQQGAPSDYARGWTYMGAYVAIYVNALGVANAVAYANVGVATFALATLGVVTFYLDGDNPANQFEREQVVAEVAAAFR